MIAANDNDAVVVTRMIVTDARYDGIAQCTICHSPLKLTRVYVAVLDDDGAIAGRCCDWCVKCGPEGVGTELALRSDGIRGAAKEAVAEMIAAADDLAAKADGKIEMPTLADLNRARRQFPA